MSVWLTIPSARPPAEAEKVLSKWRAQGYKIALQRDEDAEALVWRESGYKRELTPKCVFTLPHDAILFRPYSGYAEAVNRMVEHAMWVDPVAEWFIAAGDDTEPDMNHTAEEIARQCCDYFKKGDDLTFPECGHTFGVMQPTGDRFAEGSIDRIAGSAWLGREFCRRINQGKGPLWPEYVHNFVDEELQNVALKYGIFWQRRDLIHLHRHFQRENDSLTSPAISKPTPEHLKAAFSPEGWGPYKAIFDRRKAQGFPGSEPIA